MKIAVIGTGISGLGAAWLLSQRHQVIVFEQDDRIGGHSHTVEVPAQQGRAAVAVDTGFIVYNEATYPNLTRLFAHLGVATAASDMSFAVSLDHGRYEYAGTDSLWGLIAQKRNLFRPRFYRMILDLLRFYREAPAALEAPATQSQSLGEFLTAGRYGDAFVNDHLLPMGAAIWSTPSEAMLAFPFRSFARFFVNHGLLKLSGRPVWRTVCGGSRSYLDRLTAGWRDRIQTGTPVVSVRRDGAQVRVRDAGGRETVVDEAVIATHADQALALLEQPSADEQRLLSSFRYRANLAVLHRDPTLMPKRRAAWASWNYLAAGNRSDQATVTLTYWMNRLQNLDPAEPWFVTLNPARPPDPGAVVRQITYHHPMFDRAALAAQAELWRLQGRQRLWYCGSYFGHGFHEDGLASGLAVAQALGCPRPWQCQEVSPALGRALPQAGLRALPEAAG